MNIDSWTADSLELVLEPQEARRLVEALAARAGVLGAPAAALLAALTGAGVQPPEPAGHIRTEYMPPLV
ncbi:MAG: hypothetical protein M0039_06715 [Pseudomonadota bacterium]|nr:hypothetical protein [Pseudomonadota bacterium]